MKKKDKTDCTNYNAYPVVMTFKDNQIEKRNKNIDLLYIVNFILEGSSRELIQKIIRYSEIYLKENDKLTFITYDKYVKERLKEYIDYNIQKFTHLNINFQDNKTDYEYSNAEKVDKSDFIKIIFFFSNNNSEKLCFDVLKNVTEYLNDFKNDSSIYFFSIDYNYYPYNFSIFSDSRYIDYLYIDKNVYDNEENEKKVDDYVRKIIEDNRNIKYKSNSINITITSKYPIEKFYGKNDLENLGTDEEYIYSFTKYQLIPGKEYTYFFEVKLPETIKYGDRILYAKINYTTLEGTPDNDFSSSLKFYNAVNYLKNKKDEICRAKLTEGLESYLYEDSYYNNTKKLEEAINLVNGDFCGKDFTDNYIKFNKIRGNENVKNDNDKGKNNRLNYILINKAIRYLFLENSD